MRTSASRILLNAATLALAVTSLQSAGFAQQVMFWDDFGDTTLGPEWVIDPGRGSYSLTSHPGFLTYNLDEFMSGSNHPNYPSLGIEYPFEGTEWKVEVHVFYSLRYWMTPNRGSTGGQFGRVNIRFADGSILGVYRGCDAWYDRGNPGRHSAYYYDPSVGGQTASLPFAPGDVVVDGLWIRHDYWYQFERSGDTITIRYSFDGLTYDEGLTIVVSAGAGNTQSLVFDATCYMPYGSTVQWDYVSITDTGNQPPEITCSDPVVLWSPNHELVDARAAFTVSDPDGDPVSLSIRVFSDESEMPETGDGTGRHAPDFKDEMAGGRGLLVRSERRGREDGRFYLGLITANDGNGGITTKVCVLAVCPHDQNDPTSLDNVLLQATTAAAAATAVGDDPAAIGLIEHGQSEQLGPHQ